MMGIAKYALEKFNEKNDLRLWRLKMRALLVQQGLKDTLSGISKLPNTLIDKEKKDILDKAHSVIILSLDDKVFQKSPRKQQPQEFG